MFNDQNFLYDDVARRRLEDLSDEITVKIDQELAKQTTSEVVVYSFKIFGSMFAGIFVLFLFLRTKFPLVYTYNTVMAEKRTRLSENTHGWFNWIYKIFQHSDEEIFEQCGMTAIIYLRFLRIGLKVCLTFDLCSFFMPHGCLRRVFQLITSSSLMDSLLVWVFSIPSSCSQSICTVALT
jgi:hypothetical protein